MSLPPFDALIMGGGPAGSCAATFLARAGRKVLLLEKEVFPRFHIGESLLPYNIPLFKEMGVYEQLLASGCIRKFGAQFHLGNGSKSTSFVFRQGRYTAEPEAFQVERSKFDELLLQHARNSGATVLEGRTVTRAMEGSEGCSVTALDPHQREQQFQASYLIDATGRSNLTGNQQGLRLIHPWLRKVAVFAHFTGVKLDPGEKGGDTVIIRLKDAWFWIIPLSGAKVSVGCVVDQKVIGQSQETPGELFFRFCAENRPLRERMAEAQLLGAMQTTSDFSYHNRRLVGTRLLRAGDAAGFMDPIFSAGVYLAMYSGKLAAHAVLGCLDGKNPRRLLRQYEKKVTAAMGLYWKMAEEFYTTPFMEVFLEPREVLQLSSAVNAALAGRLDNAWAVRWRMALFYWIVRLQKRWPVLPRISFHP